LSRPTLCRQSPLCVSSSVTIPVVLGRRQRRRFQRSRAEASRPFVNSDCVTATSRGVGHLRAGHKRQTPRTKSLRTPRAAMTSTSQRTYTSGPRRHAGGRASPTLAGPSSVPAEGQYSYFLGGRPLHHQRSARHHQRNRNTWGQPIQTGVLIIAQKSTIAAAPPS